MVPPEVAEAEAVAQSPASQEARTFAPQAYLEAEKLRAEAEYLLKEGQPEEAGAAAEQALAGYNHAFALSRVARAEERIERAREEKATAQAEQARLDALAAQLAADADAYEMRARAHLDQEKVEDVEQLTAERAKMRRLAAKQLAAEARLLCLATELLKQEGQPLDEAKAELVRLEKQLAVGSVNKDLFPRASELRAQCLHLLTLTRRPALKKEPESAASDRLLSDLTKTGHLMAYRDDRGVVVNLGKPLADEGGLSKATQDALQMLGGTARAHSDFPVLLVIHTARSGQQARAQKLGEVAGAALREAGAPSVTVHSVENAQPVVQSSLRGADEKNERIEVVFVSPAR